MTTQTGSVVGCIVYDCEEFMTWVSNNLAPYLARGLWFNKSVYKEICQILRDFDTVAAIIPEDEDENMEYLITDFSSSMRNWGMTLSDVASYLRLFT